MLSSWLKMVGTVALHTASHTGRLSIPEMAGLSGLLDLNPSDLVFEANHCSGFVYYDYVLSVSEQLSTLTLHLAKLDTQTNVESLDSAAIPKSLLIKHDIAVSSDLCLLTLGIVLWRDVLRNRRALCLIRRNGAGAETDSVAGLEALKQAATKAKCAHHVLTVGKQQPVTTVRTGGGMRLRLMMCQTRSTVANLSNGNINETKSLLAIPSKSALTCLCLSAR